MRSKPIIIVGALLTILGLIMIPLPGPGFLIVSLGVPVLLAGAVMLAANRSRSKSSP